MFNVGCRFDIPGIHYLDQKYNNQNIQTAELMKQKYGIYKYSNALLYTVQNKQNTSLLGTLGKLNEIQGGY
jgi:hypothetical protein